MTFFRELLRQQANRERIERNRLVTPSPIAWCMAFYSGLANTNWN